MMEKNKGTLLVVDDEADIRHILQFNLQAQGYSVDTASCAEEALLILKTSYDLILLDVMMKGMSGFEMAEFLRKERGSQIPIIFLTAKTEQRDLLKGFETGGDDYISKPFSIVEVLARVKAVLKRSDAKNVSNKKGYLRISLETPDQISIDREQKIAYLNEQKLALTRKEFEILLLLAEHLGRVFSREDILKSVWGEDVYVLERTVDVHVARLRKKLGVSGDAIVNRSGYGYCMEEN